MWMRHLRNLRMNRLIFVTLMLLLLSCHSSTGGKVVSKKHTNAYNMQMWQRGNKNSIHVPSEYIVSVDINGVIMDFTITQAEYNKTHIGDYYLLTK